MTYIDFTIYEGGTTRIESRCVENYKFCSDYRGDDIITCTNIKPYDESGNYIDETSKCEINDEIDNDPNLDLCQRISKSCSEAAGNPILCANISPKIKDNHIKYCAYIAGYCIESYKSCENVPYSETKILCQNNIPENHLSSRCEGKLASYGDDYRCVTNKLNCDSFIQAYYADYCHSIHNNCSYSYEDNTCTMKTVLHCSDKIFYTAKNENEAVCKTLEVTSPNYICTLKGDKSACKEILKDSIYLTSTSNQKGNSAEFIRKGINLIIILLCLLI